MWANGRSGGPCVLHNDLIISNANAYSESACAFYIETGQPKLVKNPLNGETQPWKIARCLDRSPRFGRSAPLPVAMMCDCISAPRRSTVAAREYLMFMHRINGFELRHQSLSGERRSCGALWGRDWTFTSTGSHLAAEKMLGRSLGKRMDKPDWSRE